MFTLTVTPRFGDVDGLRHINNTRLPEWFELARNPIYRLFSPTLELEGWEWIMARIAVDFVAQMRMASDVEIRTFIVRIGTSSITVGHEAWQDGVLCARGEAVIVHYDFADRRAIPVPAHIRAALAEHLLEPPESL